MWYEGTRVRVRRIHHREPREKSTGSETRDGRGWEDRGSAVAAAMLRTKRAGGGGERITRSGLPPSSSPPLPTRRPPYHHPLRKRSTAPSHLNPHAPTPALAVLHTQAAVSPPFPLRLLGFSLSTSSPPSLPPLLPPLHLKDGGRVLRFSAALHVAVVPITQRRRRYGAGPRHTWDGDNGVAAECGGRDGRTRGCWVCG